MAPFSIILVGEFCVTIYSHYMPPCVKTCHSVSNFYYLGDISGAEWSRLVDFG